MPASVNLFFTLPPSRELWKVMSKLLIAELWENSEQRKICVCNSLFNILPNEFVQEANKFAHSVSQYTVHVSWIYL